MSYRINLAELRGQVEAILRIDASGDVGEWPPDLPGALAVRVLALVDAVEAAQALVNHPKPMNVPPGEYATLRAALAPFTRRGLGVTSGFSTNTNRGGQETETDAVASVRAQAVRFVAVADLHGALPDVPDGDVLLIGGDSLPVSDHSSSFHSRFARREFSDWLHAQPHDHIIGIGGNHDFIFQADPEFAASLPWTYLADETVRVHGLTVHGSPWSNRFGNWAFMADDARLAEAWRRIPDRPDVVLVHGPPFGACDLTARWGNEHVGSKTLREAIVEKKPRVVVTGHVHEGYGEDTIGESRVLNVSHMTVDYEPLNGAVTFELASARTSASHSSPASKDRPSGVPE